MLAAAEAQMDAAAEDDAERARNRAKLYAPPAENRRRRRPSGEPPRPVAGGMSLDQVQALMSQMAAQDAQFTGGRSG
ncbi:hypothetical protein ACFV27_01045 [Streptomyces antimycoticus]|uniref:hypothetical protein n=1 Tax=Streptomyces antimycoticus TaxID=68175 RepID=UPI0036BD82A6